MLKLLAMFLVVLAALGGCTTAVQSNPPRTAMEELLVSTAAERAAGQLTLDIPADSHVFIDSGNFEGTDRKYAVAAIRAILLRQGMRLVDDKKDAEVIIEARAGALSIDRTSYLIGTPQFSIPIPLSSSAVTVPEIALYGKEEQKGVAKFTLVARNAKEGTLLAEQEPQYGFSHNTKRTVVIFVSWTRNDVMPEEK